MAQAVLFDCNYTASLAERIIIDNRPTILIHKEEEKKESLVIIFEQTAYERDSYMTVLVCHLYFLTLSSVSRPSFSVTN